LIKAEYDKPAGDGDDVTIFEHLVKMGTKPAVVDQSAVWRRARSSGADCRGDVPEQLVAHAAMETHSAVASFEDGR